MDNRLIDEAASFLGSYTVKETLAGRSVRDLGAEGVGELIRIAACSRSKHFPG
jgi:hypothetical protein